MSLCLSNTQFVGADAGCALYCRKTEPAELKRRHSSMNNFNESHMDFAKPVFHRDVFDVSRYLTTEEFVVEPIIWKAHRKFWHFGMECN
jgi:hypothetical protein